MSHQHRQGLPLSGWMGACESGSGKRINQNAKSGRREGLWRFKAEKYSLILAWAADKQFLVIWPQQQGRCGVYLVYNRKVWWEYPGLLIMCQGGDGGKEYGTSIVTGERSLGELVGVNYMRQHSWL
ncbi:hypothetical protein FQR65_LT16915 [Abscondita terminalis]|nr:hypothetical protein FQR65_LT16915 [Abscondita terminalis]